MGGLRCALLLVLCGASVLARPLEVTVGAQGPAAVTALGRVSRAALSAEVLTPPEPSDGTLAGAAHYAWTVEASEWRASALLPWQSCAASVGFAPAHTSATELRARWPRAGEWRLRVGVVVTWWVDGVPWSGRGGVTLFTRVVDTRGGGQPRVRVARAPRAPAAQGPAGALGLFGATALGASGTAVNPSGDGNDVQVDVSVECAANCSLDNLTLTITNTLRPQEVVYGGDVRWNQCVQSAWPGDGSWSATWRVSLASAWACFNEGYTATAAGEFRDWTGWDGGPSPSPTTHTDTQTLAIRNLVLTDVAVDLGGDDYFVYDPTLRGADGQPRVPALTFTLRDDGCTSYYTGTGADRVEHDYRYRYTLQYDSGLADQGSGDWHWWTPTTTRVTGYATLGTAVTVPLTPTVANQPLVGGYRLLVQEVTQDADPTVVDSQGWHDSDEPVLAWNAAPGGDPLQLYAWPYLTLNGDGSHALHVGYSLADGWNQAPRTLSLALYDPRLAPEGGTVTLAKQLGSHEWVGTLPTNTFRYGQHTAVLTALDDDGQQGWPPNRRCRQPKYSYPCIAYFDAPQPTVRLHNASAGAWAGPNPAACGQAIQASAWLNCDVEPVGDVTVDGTDYTWHWLDHDSLTQTAEFVFGWEQAGDHTLSAIGEATVRYHWTDYQGRHDETVSTGPQLATTSVTVNRFTAPTVDACQLSAPSELFVEQPANVWVYGSYHLDSLTQQAVEAGVAHVEERYYWTCADFDRLSGGGLHDRGAVLSLPANRARHAPYPVSVRYLPVVTDGTHEAHGPGVTDNTSVAPDLWQCGPALDVSAIQTDSGGSLVPGEQVTLAVTAQDLDQLWSGLEPTDVADWVNLSWDLGAAGSGWGESVTFTAPDVPWGQTELPLHIVLTADDAGWLGSGESGDRDDEPVERTLDLVVRPLLTVQHTTVALQAPAEVWFDETVSALAVPDFEVVGGGPGVVRDGPAELTYTWTDNPSMVGAADYAWPYDEAGVHTVGCHLTVTIPYHTGTGAALVRRTAVGEADGWRELRVKRYEGPLSVAVQLDAEHDQWAGWPYTNRVRQVDVAWEPDTQAALAAGLVTQSRTVTWHAAPALEPPGCEQPADGLSRCLYYPLTSACQVWPLSATVEVTLTPAAGGRGPTLGRSGTGTEPISVDRWAPGEPLSCPGGIVSPSNGYDVEPGEVVALQADWAWDTDDLYWGGQHQSVADTLAYAWAPALPWATEWAGWLLWGANEPLALWQAPPLAGTERRVVPWTLTIRDQAPEQYWLWPGDRDDEDLTFAVELVVRPKPTVELTGVTCSLSGPETGWAREHQHFAASGGYVATDSPDGLVLNRHVSQSFVWSAAGQTVMGPTADFTFHHADAGPLWVRCLHTVTVDYDYVWRGQLEHGQVSASQESQQRFTVQTFHQPTGLSCLVRRPTSAWVTREFELSGELAYDLDDETQAALSHGVTVTPHWDWQSFGASATACGGADDGRLDLVFGASQVGESAVSWATVTLELSDGEASEFSGPAASDYGWTTACGWQSGDALQGGALLGVADGAEVIAGETVSVWVAGAGDTDRRCGPTDGSDEPGWTTVDDALRCTWSVDGEPLPTGAGGALEWTVPELADGETSRTCVLAVAVDDVAALPDGETGSRDDAPLALTRLVTIVRGPRVDLAPTLTLTAPATALVNQPVWATATGSYTVDAPAGVVVGAPSESFAWADGTTTNPRAFTFPTAGAGHLAGTYTVAAEASWLDPLGVWHSASLSRRASAERLVGVECALSGLTVSGAPRVGSGEDYVVAVGPGDVRVTARFTPALDPRVDAAALVWSGGEPVDGEPFSRRVSRATAGATTVTASAFGTSASVTVYVVAVTGLTAQAGATAVDAGTAAATVSATGQVTVAATLSPSPPAVPAGLLLWEEATAEPTDGRRARVPATSPGRTAVRCRCGASSAGLAVWAVRVDVAVAGVEEADSLTQAASLALSVGAYRPLAQVRLSLEPAGLPAGTVTVAAGPGLTLWRDREGTNAWPGACAVTDCPAQLWLERTDSGPSEVGLTYTAGEFATSDSDPVADGDDAGPQAASRAWFQVYQSRDGAGQPTDERYDGLGLDAYVALYLALAPGERLATTDDLNVRIRDTHPSHENDATAHWDRAVSLWDGGWCERAAGGGWALSLPAGAENQELTGERLFRLVLPWPTLNHPLGHNGDHAIGLTAPLAFEQRQPDDTWAATTPTRALGVTATVANVTITDVQTNRNADYFIYNPYAVSVDQRQPTIRFRLNDPDPHARYGWCIALVPTPQLRWDGAKDGEVSGAASFCGTADGPGEVVATWTGQVDGLSGEPLAQCNPYTFDIFVWKTTTGEHFDWQASPVVDWVGYKYPYRLRVPDTYADEDGTHAGHAFDIGGRVPLGAPGDGLSQGLFSYLLTDELAQDANDIHIDLLDSAFEHWSRTDGPTGLNHEVRDLVLHTFSSEELLAQGQFSAVICGRDRHGSLSRDHLMRRMLATNGIAPSASPMVDWKAAELETAELFETADLSSIGIPAWTGPRIALKHPARTQGLPRPNNGPDMVYLFGDNLTSEAGFHIERIYVIDNKAWKRKLISLSSKCGMLSSLFKKMWGWHIKAAAESSWRVRQEISEGCYNSICRAVDTWSLGNEGPLTRVITNTRSTATGLARPDPRDAARIADLEGIIYADTASLSSSRLAQSTPTGASPAALAERERLISEGLRREARAVSGAKQWMKDDCETALAKMNADLAKAEASERAITGEYRALFRTGWQGSRNRVGQIAQTGGQLISTALYLELLLTLIYEIQSDEYWTGNNIPVPPVPQSKKQAILNGLGRVGIRLANTANPRVFLCDELMMCMYDQEVKLNDRLTTWGNDRAYLRRIEDLVNKDPDKLR